MWFPLLFVSNTLICRQVSVYASPSELVKQVYMPMTTSPALWAKRDLNPRLPRYQRGTLNHLSYLPIKYNSNHENCIFVDPKRIEPSTISLQGSSASLGTCEPKILNLKYNKFKELCDIGGIEPTHIWPLLIYIVSSCILSLGVKPTCTEQLQSPIYCDKPAFVLCSLRDSNPCSS